MPDLGGMMGPFRITTVLFSAHGGYFSLPRDGVNARSITATNTAIFRATTRFLVTPKNTTALSFSAASSIRVSASNNGTITVTRSGAGAAGTLQYYFLAFNGGTVYTLV